MAYFYNIFFNWNRKALKLAESFDESECVFLNIIGIGPRFSVNINFQRIQLFSKDLNVVLL